MKEISPSAMQQHTHAQGVVMVCVTRQRTCERLIAAGEQYARQHAAQQTPPLHVVHAVKTGEHFLGNVYEGEALEYLFTAAQLCDANLTVIRADDVESTLAEYARVHAASAMILGRSPAGGGESFEARMRRKLPEVDVVVV